MGGNYLQKYGKYLLLYGVDPNQDVFLFATTIRATL